MFVADPEDEVDADAVRWLRHCLTPRLPAGLLAADPLVVTDSLSDLASAGLVVVPPSLGGRGYDLAVRALACGVGVVAPARVRSALPPSVRTWVDPADGTEEFATAVVNGLKRGREPLPTTVSDAVRAVCSPEAARAQLLDALERVS